MIEHKYEDTESTSTEMWWQRHLKFVRMEYPQESRQIEIKWVTDSKYMMDEEKSWSTGTAEEGLSGRSKMEQKLETLDPARQFVSRKMLWPSKAVSSG